MPISDKDEIRRVSILGAEKRMLASRRVRTKSAVQKRVPYVLLTLAVVAFVLAVIAAFLK